MTTRKALHLVLSLAVIVSLCLPAAGAAASYPEAAGATSLSTQVGLAQPDSGLFRTRVVVDNPTRWDRLEALGVVILERGDDSAVVLADDEQLETLARLRFQPRASDELGELLRAQDASRAWLLDGVQPLLDQGAALQAQVAARASTEAVQAARQTLHAAMAALTPEQRAGLGRSFSVDDDGDGLTNTQESWWCTDPLNADSDGDGAIDGVEVQAAKDWLANQAPSYPSTGKPFSQWPPQIPGCVDDDQDSVPDLAERWDLGLNMNRESTDRDKFDDGQELFGITQWSWGALPRVEDTGYVFAEMPSWVKRPGNHPLVAAFPVPEVDVVESSVRVETVTEVTTDHIISEGTERSYSTAKTEGTSTSVADTVTWNDWEETSIAVPQPVSNSQLDPRFNLEENPPNPWVPILSGVGFVAAGAACLTTPLTGIGILGCGLALTASGGAFVVSTSDYVDEGVNYIQENQTQTTVPQSATPDTLQSAFESNMCSASSYQGLSCRLDNPHYPTSQEYTESQRSIAGKQERVPPTNGSRYAPTSGGTWVAQTKYPVSFPIIAHPVVKTTTKGSSRGGAHTTTTAQYEEHTITNGEAFSSGESWGMATAENSAHAAELWFTYRVRNAGTEYAREIKGLVFNIYLGDDANPVCSYHVGSAACGVPTDTLLFSNFMPGEEHIFTSYRIPLTLEQMKVIDLGSPIRIVVEDFTYGADELFYEDAVNSGVLLTLEDGIDDGDENIDTYLIPTWGTETVMDVLARYFPHTADEEGLPIAIWTPEYRSDTPSWCSEPRVVGAGSQRTLWCKHALSTADWWNVYTNGLGDGSEGFQDTPASPGSVALFRFNSDSDLDGYSDRSEERLGTSPNDPADFPRPELLAGVHSKRTGDHVVATLSLLNTGLYDAYGVEAVMIAPNDTITITNNTVGGSGRVRAQNQVIVGSRILPQSPLPASWTQADHAKPATGGYYAGTADRTYTFTVQCANPGGCSVGDGTWTLAWNDGAGASGSLAFGTGYASPTLLNVGELGVKLGMLSGAVANGESFTVQANTPRDTFQYNILQEPYTPPIVLVSYNDPQGNHRLVIPPAAMTLAHPTADLMVYAGQMLADPGVEIVTNEAFAPGANTTTLQVLNPTETTLSDAHLFLEFVNISGTVVSEVATNLASLPPGPTIAPVAWDTAGFDPTYSADEDYIVIAFWTDYQGNILATGARPLSSFQEDPAPAFAMAAGDETWNFGEAHQGTLLKRSFTFANTGFGDLQTYVSAPPELNVTQTGSRRLPSGDDTTYEITLKTTDLAVGAYSGVITIRTSDPAQPAKTVQVVGTVTAAPADTPVGSVQRPLDWPTTVSGTQGQWVEFTHTLGPDPQSLHPVKVYSQDYSTLKGVGRYATPFGAGTAPYDMFGDGRDGVMPSSGNLDNNNGVGVAIVNSGSQGAYTINATDAYGGWRINPGDVVLIHQTQGSGAGCWEINQAAADYAGGTASVQLTKPLQCNYASGGNNHAQVQRVPQYTDCPVGGTVTPLTGWNGSYGGIFAVMCRDNLNLSGAVVNNGGTGQTSSNGNPAGGSGAGFRGGQGDAVNNDNYGCGFAGEGTPGLADCNHHLPNGNGGAAGPGTPQTGNFGTGGGGGNGTAGAASVAGGIGPGGFAAGNTTLSNMVFGGGGGGSNDNPGNSIGGGGGGGGIVVLLAKNITITGFISANGGSGGGNKWGAGGGAGGSVLIRGTNVSAGSGRVSAVGSAGGNYGGGAGATGRIRIEYCETLPSSTTNPPASTQKLNCYIAEQVESAPYTTMRLNLPESGTHTYKVQYGRKLNWTGAAGQVATLRVPAAGLFTSVTLQALVSNLPSNASFALEVGEPYAACWSQAIVSNNSENLSPNLAACFNAYWASHGAPIHTGYLDVPVRVSLDRAGQVLLANLQVTPTGSKMRAIRLPVQAQGYSHVTTAFIVSGGSGPLVVGVDVGANGSVDWTYTGSPTYPASLTTGNLATAVNAYLAGRTGEVDVPLRFYLAPFATLALQTFTATPSGSVDLALTAGDVVFSVATPMETDPVTVTATVHNNGNLASGPLTASFFATLPDGMEWYIGSAFVPSVPPSSSSSAQIPWNTLGFTGNVPVRVVVDPYDRVVESNETNNQATKPITILTRPDLQVTAIVLSDDEPVAGEIVDIALTLANSGQTAAPASTLALYDGMPGSGGTPICQATLAGPANGSANAACTWTPAAPGLHRLYAVADEAGVVNESDKSNNAAWADVTVGFAGPLLLDSGGAADPPYTAESGYGYLNGQPSNLCGAGPEQTQRVDAGGAVQYRFDHLLPGHAYHLDLTLVECDNIGRQEQIVVDGNVIQPAVDLGDQAVHRLSLLLDPALYADRSIVVGVEEILGNDAVMAAVELHDIYYRYGDAGGGNDPPYTANLGYGWLDGVAQTTWGALPFQSRRIDLSDADPGDDPDNELRYRFDGLDPALHYQARLTFYQGAAGVADQTVYVDEFNTGPQVILSGIQRQDVTVEIPKGAYALDGSVVVRVVRNNSTANAFVNEISVEQKTLLTLPAIRDVRVSNATDQAATISWLTDAPAGGEVHFGTSPALGRIARDERGPATVSRTHHVRLTGLTPATTYYFYVASADAVEDNAGAQYQFTTGPVLSPQAPSIAYGQVFLPDGSTPATGAVVYATLRDDDGQGSPGDSALLSYLVQASDGGYWNLDLGAARTQSLQQPFGFSAGDRLVLTATDGSDCTAEQTVAIGSSAPAPPLILSCEIPEPIPLSAGWSLIGLRLVSDPMPTAEQALDEIEAQGGAASEINRWLNGGWDAHIHNLPFNDFPLELGRGYFVRSSLASAWQRAGRPLSSPLPVQLTPGWNLVSFPRLTCSLSAGQALSGIAAQGGACSEIDRWVNGGWVAHIIGLPFNNYPIAEGEGFFIKCSQPSTYTPCQGALAEAASGPAPGAAPVILTQPAADPFISNVLVTNRRDVALTVTWRTDLASDGWVEYGSTPSLGQVAYDDRGQGTVATLHSATLGNLSPETTYYYRVHSGNTAAGQPFQVTTRATTTPGAPVTAYGQVQYDGGAPATGSLLVARLVEGGGEPSEPLSALVDAYGYWVLSLPEVDCASTDAQLRAISPAGEVTELTHPACQCQPAPVIQFDAAPTGRSVFLPTILRR